MIRILTESSVWLFDEAGRYCRMPQDERPRNAEERWAQNLSAGPMDDNVWQPCVRVSFTHHSAWPLDRKSLRINYPGSVQGLVTSPVLPSSVDDAERLVNTYKEE